MKNKILLVMGVLMLSVLLTACSQVVQEQDDEKIEVIVSILPQKAFVNAVGGDLVNVKELIPPGGSPATYDPKPSDLAAVENADIYFRIGHIPFEKSHVEKLVGLNTEMKVVDTSVNVQLREFGAHEEHSHEHEEGEHEEEHEPADEEHEEEHAHEEDEHADEDHADDHAAEEEHEENEEDHHDHDHSGTDPHIWLSPMQVKAQVDTIAETLSKIDPANAETYKNNAEAFKKELDVLHEEIEAELSELKTDKLMVFHPAWGYFADEYGLEQVPIEQSGKEPTAQELQHTIEEAKEENVKVIFVQSQFNKEIAESVAEEVGAVVVSINPLSEDYVNNLRSVATTIAESLNN